VLWTNEAIAQLRRIGRIEHSGRPRTLTGLGLLAGDRVAVLGENTVELCVLLYAAAKIGVAVAILNWRLRTEELAYCIELVESRARPLLQRAPQDPGTTSAEHPSWSPKPSARSSNGWAEQPNRGTKEHVR
jgi:acyl-CoA synthetase (AMP-forming)/AMP-acid ligase II